MDLPLAAKCFFDIPDDVDLDNVVLSDPSLTESSTSPHITASDDQLLDPEYWHSHPYQYEQFIQCLLPYQLPGALANANWADKVFDPECDTPPQADTPCPTRCHLIPHPPSQRSSPTKVPAYCGVQRPSPGSTTEPESEAPTAPLRTQTPHPPLPAQRPSPGSTTEPESNDVPVHTQTPHPPLPARHPSPGSTTEPESEAPAAPLHEQTPCPALSPTKAGSDNVSARRIPIFKSIFATPSPLPPGSIYWKYITPEEDARWYDCAGQDKTFNVIQRWKKELEDLQ
ncbi:hypothetical protein BKA82DRAFT_28518 [Pisolithus tinctorius]|uniref:Uncharacterized protein n=1 Tax=Pisolithus tinctorius Marx 270 TaxID=870435 RepID=A0A0C3P2Q9_PISTI|nr:hypothetical protein BKA82DRAFT_28518 [Pisolithus tinctorius]KIO01781.1 hypothetical protein M404DRAFT_28518 [Pisolithus tinctorius Marx 270]